MRIYLVFSVKAFYVIAEIANHIPQWDYFVTRNVGIHLCQQNINNQMIPVRPTLSGSRKIKFFTAFHKLKS
jgi:hypothetical protein